MRRLIHRLALAAHTKGSQLQDNALDAIARGQMTPADLNALDLSHWLLDLAAWGERVAYPRRKVAGPPSCGHCRVQGCFCTPWADPDHDVVADIRDYADKAFERGL